MFITKCQECELFKDMHQRPSELVQPLPIPEWKCEVIKMDFITSLWKSKKQNDSIFVVIDKLPKVAQFIPVKLTYKAVNIVDIFLKERFRLHGIHEAIISDRNVNFTGNFWRYLFSGLEMQLNFSTTYHT